MLKKYTSEQLWKLYEKLPEELQEAVFSVETADNIWDVCENNNIDEVSEVAKLVGNVLLGVLMPDDFPAVLEKELKIEKEIAKKVGQEINRFIFYPVRTDLEKLYQTKVAAPEKPAEVIITPREVSAGPKKDDTYRESTE